MKKKKWDESDVNKKHWKILERIFTEAWSGDYAKIDPREKELTVKQMVARLGLPSKAMHLNLVRDLLNGALDAGVVVRERPPGDDAYLYRTAVNRQDDVDFDDVYKKFRRIRYVRGRGGKKRRTSGSRPRAPRLSSWTDWGPPDMTMVSSGSAIGPSLGAMGGESINAELPLKFQNLNQLPGATPIREKPAQPSVDFLLGKVETLEENNRQLREFILGLLARKEGRRYPLADGED